jgi:hypothetical protein
MIKFLNYTIMKKLYFYLLLLPFWALGASSAWAQSVQLIGSNFDTGAVTFTVDVGAATPTWVLVEYTTDPSPNLAIMSRATFTNESITPPSAGTLAAEGRGFLLTSSATITAKLSGVSDSRFSWCGYALGTPPNAVLQSDGTYQLRGTPPFIVNGVTLADDVKTFGPGTCIESFTDFTYHPGGIADPPVVTVSASEQEVELGAEVIFTATAISGATNAMTYTWNVAGATTNTAANTYSQIMSTPCEATYTVSVTNAYCTSKVSTAGSMTVFSAGTIATATVYTTAGNAPASPTVNPTCIAACCATIEYQWRRSGTSAATLSDSNTPDYDLSLNSDNYAMAGTYYFNRYAKNKAGNWIPAEGTYTLTVDGAIAPPQYARSAQLWTVETSAGTLVWSDNIDLPDCTAPTSTNTNGCMRTTQGVLYGYTYVYNHLLDLCESPWRVANGAEWNATLFTINGGCLCIEWDYTSCPLLGHVFAAVYTGSYYNSEVANEGVRAWYWLDGSAGLASSAYIGGGGTCASGRVQSRQQAVRCVRTLATE